MVSDHATIERPRALTDDERRRGVPIRRQLRLLLPLAVVWTAGFALLAGLSLQDVPAEELFLDASYVSGANWYTGTLSNLGILGWSVAATAAAWGAFVSRLVGRLRAADFLRSGALVSAIMGFDDLFQFHSDVFPSLTGLPKVAGVALLLASAAIWGVQYATSEMTRTRWSILMAATGMLGLSVLIDQMGGFLDDTTALVAEDGAKFLGIQAWAVYFVISSADITRSVVKGELRAVAASGQAVAAQVPAQVSVPVQVPVPVQVHGAPPQRAVAVSDGHQGQYRTQHHHQGHGHGDQHDGHTGVDLFAPADRSPAPVGDATLLPRREVRG